MLSKEELNKWAVGVIKDNLPDKYKGAEINVGLINNNNHVHTAATVIMPEKDQQMAPSFNLDAMYDIYSAGVSLEELAITMIEALSEPFETGKMMSLECRYDDLKQTMFFALANLKANEKILPMIPHIAFEDEIAVVFQVIMEENDNEIVTATLTNELLEKFNISFDKLVQDAIESAQNIMKPVYCTLAMSLAGVAYKPINELPDVKDEILILTNDVGIFGSSTLFYPGVKEKISEYYGGSYWILLDNTKEAVTLPLSCPNIPSWIQDVFSKDPKANNKLSKELFMYDSHTGTIKKAPKVNK